MEITRVAKKLGLKNDDIELYGKDKAKIVKTSGNKNGKLILVTAMNPTTAGEGKTTISIGLADAISLRKKSVCLALREPSLGPVFGMKGGATGGGKASIMPADEINLHFTGDFHAITSANNLLCAMIDNHIFQGNELNIDNVVFNRCLDVNDRALRSIILVGDGKKSIDRKEVFNITAASEIMAIMCVAKDMKDLIKRLGNILIGYDKNNKALFAKDLHAENAMAILLKDAIKPNLVQTLLGTPAIVHCGPFANIAHGCNSIIATKLALSLADYVVTEAGFGADLGAEKFLDFKCRTAELNPNAVVLVATIKALKLHGGLLEGEGDIENIKLGLPNLYKHIENIKNVYKQNVVVCINKFAGDKQEEIDFVKQQVENTGVKALVTDVFMLGGFGALNLADEVLKLCEQPTKLKYAYSLTKPVEEKIKDISQKIYGANNIILSEKAKQDLKEIDRLGYNNFPVIIAKTQYSLSDDAKLISRPQNFDIKIKEIQIRSGAGFLVAIAGNMLLMPGLSKVPRAVKMKIDFDGDKVNYKL